MQYRRVWAALIFILALLIPVSTGGAEASDLPLQPPDPVLGCQATMPVGNGSWGYMERKEPAWYPLSGTARFFRDTLPSGTLRYWMDISWNDPSRDLRVTVFSPEGLLGTYANTANGRADGRIFLAIEENPELPSGEWYYLVRTAQDTNYSFGLYRNNGS